MDSELQYRRWVYFAGSHIAFLSIWTFMLLFGYSPSERFLEAPHRISSVISAFAAKHVFFVDR